MSTEKVKKRLPGRPAEGRIKTQYNEEEQVLFLSEDTDLTSWLSLMKEDYDLYVIGILKRNIKIIVHKVKGKVINIATSEQFLDKDYWAASNTHEESYLRKQEKK